jgi:SNF2 family DNA or RNA helicase
VEVRLRLPGSPSAGLLALAKQHFDDAGMLLPMSYGEFEKVLECLRELDDHAVVYSDVLEFLDREGEIAEGLEWEGQLLAKLKRGVDPLADVLKTKLLPYQIRGALFAAGRGRVVLADDMGLGKTIQALAAAEMLRRRRGIQRVLVIAPASVKYQWKSEIEKFTGLSAQVIDGLLPHRKTLYAAPAFFNLTSYELVLKDLEYMQRMQPDLIILDEAQRIRNWATATARTIKQLKSRYAFVLTGTPLENKLEELFSVVEFVDARRLGPAFRFLKEHRMEDDKGHLLGYRGLDTFHQQLEPILLRRTRKEVLTQLPPRTDQIFRVALTKEQAEPYWEQSDILAALMRKWERQGWLSEIDLRRITCCIQNMRMLCNSTFLFDKATHHSPKLDEFREVIRELVLEEDRKVVVFSEYERMTYLAGQTLAKLGIGFVSLHGGVPSRKRGALISQFRDDPKCRVFLSTDAGGVGLNLQTASAVVNFEPPWNPARLEQRIGRVHRLGQEHPVQVIHFLTTGSIEERVWETIQVKKSLFAGVFDAPTDQISFASLGKKSVLQAVKEVFADQPGRPKPVAEVAPPVPVPITASVVPAHSAETVRRDEATAVQPSAPAERLPELEPLATAAAELLEAGVRFLETLATPSGAGAGSDGASGSPVQRWLASAIQTDPRTNRPVLALPLPASITEERLAGALTSLMAAFGARR